MDGKGIAGYSEHIENKKLEAKVVFNAICAQTQCVHAYIKTTRTAYTWFVDIYRYV